MGEEDNTAHPRSRSWLPQTHSSMPLFTHSVLTPPEETLMVTGQHMDAVQETHGDGPAHG